MKDSAITTLNGRTNYRVWKMATTTELARKECGHCIIRQEGTAGDETNGTPKQKATAASIIMRTLPGTIKSLCTSVLSDPLLLWEKLTALYDTKTKGATTRSKITMFQKKQKRDESLEEFISRLNNDRQLLLERNEEPSNRDLCSILLAGLNSKFKPVKNYIASQPTEDENGTEMTFEELCTRVRNFETEAIEELNISDDDSNEQPKREFGLFVEHRVCHNCGIRNHISKSCDRAKSRCNSCQNMGT